MDPLCEEIREEVRGLACGGERAVRNLGREEQRGVGPGPVQGPGRGPVQEGVRSVWERVQRPAGPLGSVRIRGNCGNVRGSVGGGVRTCEGHACGIVWGRVRRRVEVREGTCGSSEKL